MTGKRVGRERAPKRPVAASRDLRMTIILISVSFLLSLFGMFAEQRHASGGCFLAAGAVLMFVAVPWFVQAVESPGELSTAFLAMLASGTAIWSTVKGLRTFKDRAVKPVDA